MSAILSIDGLSRTYRSGSSELTVLHEVSFSVAAGEAVAVVGPSGSGKSTLLGLVAGLDQPTAGTVSVAGRNLATFTEAELAAFRGRTMGFLFQSYRLLPALTAAENVRIPLELAGVREAPARAQAWLERVGLGARGHHLPQQLSGGEQQRVGLARALVTAPALLFADEPTGNLDSATGSVIAELIFSAVREQGVTCLYVTHDRALAQRADRIIELADGRVI
jgi:putative ABC transport system ATP-binding protein